MEDAHINVKVCSFFTPGPYADEAVKLRLSLEELGIHHALKCVQFGAVSDPWRHAVMYKPAFILEQLMALETEYDGVFWTDADSICRCPPPWDTMKGVDFGYHRFRWSQSHPFEMLCGGLYFARDPRVCAFVSAWCANTPRFNGTDTPEQHSLGLTWDTWKTRLVGLDVGQDWVHIFDAPHREGARPIFEHFQKSRTLRK